MSVLQVDEIALFDQLREDFSKSSLVRLQKVYRKYDKEWERDCMCTKTRRKIAHKHFYEWYDKTRG